MNTNNAEYDRVKELKQFDESKMGVKGLVDSGLTAIPRIFIHPPEALSGPKPDSHIRPESDSIPIIDLSNPHSTVVDQISRAARGLGFFQVTNHGIALETIDCTIAAVKAFHEQPTEAKSPFYSREAGSAVRYFSNVHLYGAEAATWIDTLYVKFAPNPPAPEQLPEACGKEMVDWEKEVVRLGGKLMGLMSQGLGLRAERLKEITCLEGRTIVGQYYPQCPQPDLTLGITSHTDAGVLTVLIQDQVGGLQVNYRGVWVDVKPVPGAIVVNVGDLLQPRDLVVAVSPGLMEVALKPQVISNDEYKSVTHRVLANSSNQPRVSIGTIFLPGRSEELCEPLSELVSPERPPLFRQFTLSEYMGNFLNRQNGKTLTNYYRR